MYGTQIGARFDGGEGVASVGGGSLYVADTNNHTIRQIVLATGAVTTIAGLAQVSGSSDGTGSAARFDNPLGVASDGAGSLYVADSSNDTIRQIVLATGAVTTIAGLAKMVGSSDGTGSAARFNTPVGVVSDGGGNLYVADSKNGTIRKIVLATGAVTTIAGLAGVSGSTDGTGAIARFKLPSGVAGDGAGNLYIADNDNGTIRKLVLATAAVTTFAGVPGVQGVRLGPLPAGVNTPFGIAVTPQKDVVFSCGEDSVLIVRAVR